MSEAEKRAEFEAWITDYMRDAFLDRCTGFPELYRDMTVQMLFDAWQAARSQGWRPISEAPVLYSCCPKHMGQPFTMPVPVAAAVKTVCPLCEPPALDWRRGVSDIPETREEAEFLVGQCLTRKYELMKQAHALPVDSPERAEKWQLWRETCAQQRQYEALSKCLPPNP